MSPENFCYWLRGYIELNAENNSVLNSEQLRKVSEHLDLVLREIPKERILLSENVQFPIDPSIKCHLTC